MNSFESATLQEVVAFTLTGLAVLVFLYLAVQFVRAMNAHKRSASQPPTSNSDWHAGHHGRALGSSGGDCRGFGGDSSGGDSCGDGGGGGD